MCPNSACILTKIQILYSKKRKYLTLCRICRSVMTTQRQVLFFWKSQREFTLTDWLHWIDLLNWIMLTQRSVCNSGVQQNFASAHGLSNYSWHSLQHKCNVCSKVQIFVSNPYFSVETFDTACWFYKQTLFLIIQFLNPSCNVLRTAINFIYHCKKIQKRSIQL